MKNTIKLEGDMYWILYELKRVYDIQNIQEDFQDFAKKELQNLYDKWIEMMADDLRQFLSSIEQ